jgi:uncharacterized protein YecT (DUF1311 family)
LLPFDVPHSLQMAFILQGNKVMSFEISASGKAVCQGLWVTLAALGCALLGPTAWSSDLKATPDANTRCDQNQLTLNECALRRLREAEAVMKKSLDTLLDRVRGTDSEGLLKESQESWLKFREADCRYTISGLTPDGSMREQWQNDCRARHTRERTKQLEEFRQCDGNGCPGQ